MLGLGRRVHTGIPCVALSAKQVSTIDTESIIALILRITAGTSIELASSTTLERAT